MRVCRSAIGLVFSVRHRGVRLLFDQGNSSEMELSSTLGDIQSEQRAIRHSLEHVSHHLDNLRAKYEQMTVD